MNSAEEIIEYLKKEEGDPRENSVPSTLKSKSGLTGPTVIVDESVITNLVSNMRREQRWPHNGSNRNHPRTEEPFEMLEVVEKAPRAYMDHSLLRTFDGTTRVVDCSYNGIDPLTDYSRNVIGEFLDENTQDIHLDEWAHHLGTRENSDRTLAWIGHYTDAIIATYDADIPELDESSGDLSVQATTPGQILDYLDNPQSYEGVKVLYQSIFR